MILPADSGASFSPTPAKTDSHDRATIAREAARHDAGLVQRFNTGDETAFTEIMTRHQPRMFSVAFALLKSRADAEEVTQDTFIRAHRGLGRFRGDASLATWLHRITLNLARNRYWYCFRRRRHATVSLDCTLSDENQGTFSDLIATDAASPARETLTREFSELIALCMTRLEAQPRAILTLRNSLNRSYDEIARELGINVGTVKSRIARARENLRTLLAAACPEFGTTAQPASWFEPVRPADGIRMISA